MSVYLEHFGLREPPFRITPQLEYFFAGAQRGAVLDALMFAIQHDEGILVVSGEVGTGKTMLAHMLLERIDEVTLTIYLSNPTLSPVTLLATLAKELGVTALDPLGALRQIEERLITLHGEGRRVLLMIDEAHAMPRESLEQIRLLSNLESPTRKLLQIVLFGQPELDELLATRPMRSLRERVTQRFPIRALNARDTAHYVRFRLHAAGHRGSDPFSSAALRRIARASGGLTRRINILADKALLAAFTTGATSVASKHAGMAIRDAGYSQRRLIPWLLLGMLGATAAGATVYWWAPPFSLPAREAPASSLQSGPAAQSLPAATAVSAPAAAPQAASKTPVANDIRSRIAHSHERIAATGADRWFIQLLTVQPQELPAVELFVTQAEAALGRENLMVYESNLQGRGRVGVIFGDFATSAEAAKALAAMPPALRNGGAYVRSYKAFK